MDILDGMANMNQMFKAFSTMTLYYVVWYVNLTRRHKQAHHLILQLSPDIAEALLIPGFDVPGGDVKLCRMIYKSTKMASARSESITIAITLNFLNAAKPMAFYVSGVISLLSNVTCRHMICKSDEKANYTQNLILI